MRLLMLALALCAVLIGLVLVLPGPMLLAVFSQLWWLRLTAGLVVLIDARRLRLADYATGFGRHRIVWFMLVMMWPVIVLPWYLTVRERVRAGSTPRRLVSASSALMHPGTE